ncbi:MAG: TolC family protein, partial [Roseibium sp.]|uniref:TolC family protein n=1 Tax=Roseibium sp. TaxID=1936156 RepID=UPI00329828FD
MYRTTGTAILLIALTLGGCAKLGPDFLRPSVSLNEAYHMAPATPVADLVRSSWWKDLRDPTLTAMINRGLSQNLDIMAAQERIVSALASQRRVGTGLSAQATAAGQVSSTEFGNDTAHDVSLDAGYVFDLFGGMARERERFAANVEASVAQAEAVRLAWLAEIAGSYIDALYQKELAGLQRESIKNRQATVNAIKTRIEYGEASPIDLSRAEALLNAARAKVPMAEGGYEAAIFRIASLLNESSASIRAQIKRRSMPYPPGTPKVGVPADLLRNRPDIRVAEAQLKAATAAIGMAEADLLPSLRLGGSVSATAKSMSFGPELTLPILGRNSLRAA